MPFLFFADLDHALVLGPVVAATALAVVAVAMKGMNLTLIYPFKQS